MKIYIHTDLEGVSGIGETSPDGGITPQRSEYGKEPYLGLRRLLMEDLNAAIQGAFEGGASEITVLDSHGGGGNFIPEMLDPRACSDSRPNKRWWGVLDGSYAGTFFIGAHAMAGTINGFLDHTQSGREWLNYRVNGRRMGELAQWALVAGHFGVPMLMASGDVAACAEAKAFFNPIETATVKQGIGRNKADCLPLDEARSRIREAARRAMSLAGKARPFRLQKPMEFTLELTRSDYCDSLAEIFELDRIEARTVGWRSGNPLDLLPCYLPRRG